VPLGNLIHIAEVAVLLFAAYSVGWLGGYVLRRATAASRNPAQIPAERLAAVTGQAVDPDALVKAPVIVEVSKGSPEMVVAPAVVTIRPEETVSVGVAQTVSSASHTLKPLSAIEALKSLSQTMPLLPPVQTSVPAPLPVTSQADLAVSPSGTLADLPTALVADATINTAAASPVVPSHDVSAEVPPAVAPLSVATGALPPAAPDSNEAAAIIESPTSVPESTAASPMPASVAGQAWAGRRHSQGSPAARDAETTMRPAELVPDAAPDAASRAESAVGAALLATLEARLAIEAALAVPPKAILQPVLPDVSPVAEAPTAAPEPETLPSASEPLSPATPADADGPASPKADAPDVVEVLQQSPVNLVAAGGPQLEAQSAPTPDLAQLPDSLASAVAAALIPEADAAVEPIVVAPVAAAPARQVTPQQLDEGAAMRAIEGGWSRRDTRALSDVPELSDVTAAVSAAQVAVENVLAQSLDADGPPAGLGKPSGLPRARDGERDDLKKINGLSPLDESTLNNMGIFHFDQIAAWQQTEVLWLENHVFARGRIGREDWQGQARAIAARGALRATR
jgi:predicted flap endonuclease-1-like 5' DNA nuclease